MPLNPLVGIIRDTTTAVSRIILPLILLIGTNVALILKLKRVSQNVTNASVSLKRERRFAFTITILNVAYAVANLFSLAATILINVYGYDQSFVTTNTYESALAGFIFVCVQMFATFVNCDLAFIVNLMSHKTFRKEAGKIFSLRK